jgi:DDE superfamily endonuclease
MKAPLSSLFSAKPLVFITILWPQVWCVGSRCRRFRGNKTIGAQIMRATAPDFLAAGWSLLNQETKRSLSPDRLVMRFTTLFGASPALCAVVWKLVHRRDTECDLGGAKPCHLLWALMFLKTYTTEVFLASTAEVDEKAFRKWSWRFVEAIAKLAPTVASYHSNNHIHCSCFLTSIISPSQIKWNNRFKGDRGNWCLVTVDGTDFRIREPTPFSSKWYSHKFKGPGLRYEVAVAISTGYIVSIHGPFPCGRYPDIKIFRTLLKHQLLPYERVEADKGYRGEPLYVSCPHDFSSDAKKDAKAKARARHETINRRLKQWSCLP